MPTVTVKSAVAMQALGAQVAKSLSAGEVLLLTGSLGSGKTTFVQGLAAALGVRGRITSPTFTIAAEYQTDRGAGIERLVHIDLYRLPEGAAGHDPAVASVLAEKGENKQVTVIEWAERLGERPDGARQLAFAHGATRDTRVVTIA
jgi:tRNA threonylcarbamoyl adenosine modification protein YjeE